MKNIFTKKVVASGLVLVSLVGGAYQIIKKTHFGFGRASAAIPVDLGYKRGTVEMASYSKVNSELQLCYESYLTREPKNDDGDMRFHFMIDKAGEVSFLKMVHSDFEEDQFVQCVSDRVRLMRSPATPDRVGILISHNFKFHRKDRSHVSFEELARAPAGPGDSD